MKYYILPFIFGIFFISCSKNPTQNLVKIASSPDFELIDHNKKSFSNKDLKGKVYVLEFFFSTCPTICPIMNQNLKIVDEKIGKREDFAIVSITINPVYDTPDVLKNHKQQLKIKSDNWFFLTGEQEYIHRLSKKFNLFAAENKEAQGGFEHSGVYVLGDKNGNIRSRKDEFGNPILYYTGLNYSDKEGFQENPSGEFKPGVDAIIEDIQTLLKP